MMHLLLMVCVFFACLFLGTGSVESVKARALFFEERYISKTGEKLEAAFLEYHPRTLFVLGCALACLLWLAVYIVTGSIALGVFFGAGALCAPQVWLSVVKKRRARRFDLQLPDALASVANSLRAGLSLPQAFDSVFRGYPSPISQEIGLVLKEVSLGRDLESAVEALAQRVESKDAGLLATALGAMKGIGGNLSDVLERIALTLRERQGLEEKVRALTAQGRFQGIVIGLMPIALGCVLYILDPGMMGRLFSDPMGWGIIALVVFLEGIGIILLRRIVTFEI